MTELPAFADDVLVDALLIEISALLARLIEHDEEGSIDLRAMPLSPTCIASLEQRLGRGEVTAIMAAAGRLYVHETEIPGVWWSRHEDEAGRLIALLIDVADMPAILRADRSEMARGMQSLRGRTHIAAHQAANPRLASSR